MCIIGKEEEEHYANMDDWKLKANAVVIIKEKRNTFVSFLIFVN